MSPLPPDAAGCQPVIRMTARPRGRTALLIVAGPGYGKTRALEALLRAPGDELIPADRALARLSRDEPIADGSVLVDDLDRLDGADRRRLLAGLGDLPSSVEVVLTSGTPVVSEELAALRRPVRRREARDLALSLHQTARVVREESGRAASGHPGHPGHPWQVGQASRAGTDTDLIEQLHRWTAGWSALVHLAADSVRRLGPHPGLDGPGEVGALLADPAGPVRRWLDERIISGLGPLQRELLILAGEVGPLAPELVRRVQDDAHADALAPLAECGLLVPRARLGSDTRPMTWHPVPALAAALAAELPLPQTDRLRAASTWFAGNGFDLASVRASGRAGDQHEVRRLIAERSDRILAAGGAAELVPLIEGLVCLPGHGAEDPAGADRITLVLGDARRMAGDVEGARRTFEPLVRQADSDLAGSPWPAGLAWRVAMVRYMRGDYRQALDACDRAPRSGVGPLTGQGIGEDPNGDHSTDDELRLLACRAGALFAVGEVEASQEAARVAVAVADRLGEARLRAVAHTALALSQKGSEREVHLAIARDAALAAGDAVQLARVLVNQGDHLLTEARYLEALEVTARADAAAELGAPPGLRQAALHNVAEALLHVGRHEEAEFAFERTARLARRAGLSRAGLGLRGLGEVWRRRGLPEQSLMAFEEAIELARTAGDVQVLVPALCGAARLLVEGSQPRPEAASVLAEEAVAIAPVELRPAATVARGWVALAAGQVGQARQWAAEAVDHAREHRLTPALAEALELAAATAPGPQQSRVALAEALALWQRAGAVPAADRVQVQLGRLPGTDDATRVAAREAGRRLLAAGIPAVEPGGGQGAPADGSASLVRVAVLGGFTVWVAGRPVPLAAWRSRQARTLVKLLIARRGRPVGRGEICELLWPDDDPARTGHRLSVLLSAVRSVLDPGKVLPPDHFIRADQVGLCLVRDHVVVDAEELLRDAAHAVRLARPDGDASDREQARSLLADIDAAYAGDAFDDEPYEEWAEALREQVRAAWSRSLRLAAELARRDGDDDHAVAALVRLLAADPLDEPAHRALVELLVTAGRHGQARRAFERWRSAMRSIEVPEPCPTVLRRAPGGAVRTDAVLTGR
ncbi:MAG: hypothetical protein JNL54_11730 [Kineosporiaceae bacterium]|nr:hypothetical protein [Kineosporiaceae bacterium]